MKSRTLVLGTAFAASVVMAVTLSAKEFSARDMHHHLARLMICFHRPHCAALKEAMAGTCGIVTVCG